MELYRSLIVFVVLTYYFNFRGVLSSDGSGYLPSRNNPKLQPVFPVAGEDYGELLFLTPFIHNGQLSKGRARARVKNVSSIRSYSGYFTVDPKYNSNMFFWFFPAARKHRTAPLLIWLQGGPGNSSMLALLVENGPFGPDKNLVLHKRPTAWTNEQSVIYFDNPVGTGFSFTDKDAGYARTEEDVGRGLYSAITQFFKLFPDYLARDLYITGESNAGKYVPAMAYKIHKENQKSPEIKINLKGIAIGDAWMEPLNTLNFGNYLYNLGLIDEKERHHFHEKEKAAREAIRRKDWLGAFEAIDPLIEADAPENSGRTYFTNVTGLKYNLNILVQDGPPELDYYLRFLAQAYVRRGIHVGSRPFQQDPKVEEFLREDEYKSIMPWFIELLEAPEEYKVLLYSGNLDPIVPYISTEEVLNKMKWSGAEGYRNAPKKIWKIGTDVAGYVKSYRNLMLLLVRNSGHLVPFDQPKSAYDMIRRFTTGKPLA